ncbi:MAG TPA: hypothetical protein VGH36_04125, partial [Acetobacteraceae bacterium]
MSRSFATLAASRGRADVRRWLRTPWAFALAVLLGYGLLALPILRHRHLDFSVFIVAGDRFV